MSVSFAEKGPGQVNFNLKKPLKLRTAVAILMGSTGEAHRSQEIIQGIFKEIIQGHAQGDELDRKIVTLRNSFSLVVPIHEEGKPQPKLFSSPQDE